MAGILQAREKGTPTVAMTVRLDVKAHEQLKQYALHLQKTMSLAMDDLIFKGTKDIHLNEGMGARSDQGRQCSQKEAVYEPNKQPLCHC